MNHLRNLALSLPIALCVLLPISADAKQPYNELQAMAAAQAAGFDIQASIRRPAASSTVLQQAAQSFFAAYQQATINASATAALLNLLTDKVEMTFTGQPGEMLPFAGTFVGHDGVANVMKAIRDQSTTESFQVRETLTTTYAVDFSLFPDFLIAQDNRVAAILQEVRTANQPAHRTYRLDVVAWLTVESDGKISNVHFFYDSYVPSQAFVGAPRLIVNPDIYPVITPLRFPDADPVTTLNTVFDFFFRFAADTAEPYDCIFNNIAQVMDPNIAVSFAGDPNLLPFADDVIRQGIPAALSTFCDQESHSRPRTFDIEEVAVGADRAIANTFEQRTAVETNRGYDIPVQIMVTARSSLITSVKGLFDSVITTTAFHGVDPFYSGPYIFPVQR